MRVTMVKKRARDFMIIHPKKVRFFLILFLIFGLSCQPNLSDDPIPYQHFNDVIINLTLPAYLTLSSDGGYAYVNSAGVRGIIVYRKNSSTYLAYERNCTFQPNDACATVDTQIFDMKDSCCGSTFRYSDGQPQDGPAWRPLQQYQTSLSGNTLTITDQIVQ